MHLGNMALIVGDVVIFDGIEFNERMRWTDVLGDVGFLAMDFDDRDLPAHANRFLNDWFEHTGDVTALPLIDFYRAYRAMVRAKIAALRLSQQLSPDERGKELAEYHSYTDLAERYTRLRQPLLCITHGLSGSGKSRLARRLVDECGMLRIRSDVERKRLQGLAASARSGSAVDAGIYTADATRDTYARLVDVAGAALDAGFPVVVDAAFLKQWQRRLFTELAVQRNTPFLILDLDVPLATLRERLIRRSEQGQDVSEAGLEVLERQLLSREPLTDEERIAQCPVTADGPEVDAALASLPGRGGAACAR
jgi:predicted kinase